MVDHVLLNGTTVLVDYQNHGHITMNLPWSTTMIVHGHITMMVKHGRSCFVKWHHSF